MVIFTSSYLITSCSKENETDQNVGENAKIATYLKSFYKANYELGKSVETKAKGENADLSRGTDFENYTITEVFVGNDERARGYVITDRDNSDFLYFIDVDRVDYKLTTISIESNESKTFENINDLDKYLSTDELDYIKIAEDLNQGEPQSNKFWGWGDWQYSSCVGGVKNAIRVYHVIWLSAGYQTQNSIPCSVELNNP